MSKKSDKIRFKLHYQSGQSVVSKREISKAIKNQSPKVKYFNSDFKIDSISIDYLILQSTEVKEYLLELVPEYFI